MTARRAREGKTSRLFRVDNDGLGIRERVSPKGVEPLVPPSEMLKIVAKLKALTRADALTGAAALHMVRGIAWPKIGLGFAVALPDVSIYVRMWHRAARTAVGTFNATHGVEVQRELGLLYHPLHWASRETVSFYSSALTTTRDPLLKVVLVAQMVQSHPLRVKLEELLLPAGVDWGQLLRVPTNDLLRKVTARVKEWSRTELVREAQRLGIYDADSTAWREIGSGPSKYLFEGNGKYGFIFRMRQLAPVDEETSPCYFCNAPVSDTGAHLVYCEVARRRAPLPSTLSSLSADELHRALTLSWRTPKPTLRASLAYMKELWQLRRELRKKKPSNPGRRHYSHNRHFFEPRAHHATPQQPVARPRAPRRRRTDDDNGTVGEPARQRARREVQTRDADLIPCPAPHVNAQRNRPPIKRTRVGTRTRPATPSTAAQAATAASAPSPFTPTTSTDDPSSTTASTDTTTPTTSTATTTTTTTATTLTLSSTTTNTESDDMDLLSPTAAESASPMDIISLSD